jgi:geranylgeranyl diphosphate synthase type II
VLLTILDEDLDSYLTRTRERVEAGLESSLELVANAPARLQEAMRYSLLAPGKRLRPLLVLMSAEACGGTVGGAMPAACAVEMVHAYSLIHDDLPAMDNDDLRRGLPTCHRRFDEATAILAGDALLTLAFEVLAEHYSPITAAACCRELARSAGACGMVGGQIEDLASESGRTDKAPVSRPNGELLTLENIHARKTGALFRAALRLGAWAAQGEKAGGPEPELFTALDEYGRCFGQAFQITDDLLDVEGHAEQTGKRVQKDASRGKLTYPGLVGPSASRALASQLCEEARSALRSLGRAAERLAALTELMVERNR